MKLGYQKETIRLYYPADSLLRLLGKELSIEELQQELEWFGGHTEHLGNVTVSHEKRPLLPLYSAGRGSLCT